LKANCAKLLKKRNIHFEEIAVTKRFVGRPLSELKLWQYPNTILVGVKTKPNWIYKPAEGYMLEAENALIIITNPGAAGAGKVAGLNSPKFKVRGHGESR
jgi:K+/H+ antiporter YhaU regulatory subunit KhtT